MSKGLLGKKVGMTGMFAPGGQYVTVTVVQAGPCVVTQIKTVATDGYNALQVGFGEKKPSRTNKPLKGHFQKSGDAIFAYLREFPVENPDDYKMGQTLQPAEIFKVGERINVSAKTKGRGFSGVIKRHGFHGGKSTHGSKTHRIPGSIGTSADPSRVAKGKKMPGRYGNTRHTIRNLVIMDIREEEHLLLIKGAVPGSKSTIIEINKPKINPGVISRPE
jgi:large subunit ribosomal protein L3